jgi:hypothetical protein
MNLIRQTAPIALCTMLVASITGCSKSDSSSSTTVAPTAANTPSLSQELGVELPTQEEADARAAAEVTAENADRVFAELEKEAAAEP